MTDNPERLLYQNKFLLNISMLFCSQLNEMSISKGQDFTFYLKKKKRPLKVLRGNVSFKDHTMEETTVTTAKTKQKKNI